MYNFINAQGNLLRETTSGSRQMVVFKRCQFGPRKFSEVLESTCGA
jgi:hypothetical protein